MTPTDPATDKPGNGLDDRVRALEHELRQLRQAFDAYQAALSDEVRTRRLIVVERGGFERIVAEAGDSHGYLAVRSRALGPGSTKVELFADDAFDGDAANVGLALGRDGDVVATLEVGGGGEPTLWIEESLLDDDAAGRH